MYKACINEVIMKKNAEKNREMVCRVSQKRKFTCEYLSMYPSARVYA